MHEIIMRYCSPFRGNFAYICRLAPVSRKGDFFGPYALLLKLPSALLRGLFIGDAAQRTEPLIDLDKREQMAI